MATITIEPATADRFEDAQHALSGGGDGASCQCAWWTITNTQWQQTTRDERKTLLEHEMAEAPPPALIAYVDGEAAGWIRVGPRTRQVRLARTKEFTGHSVEPWDDESVWAVTCFVVRREHRGEGLNSRLLHAAIEFARAHGARVIEAYPTEPIDPATGKNKPVNNLFRGIVSTFASAGFREVARPKPDRAIVSLDLTS
ncbi:GNAT family N-acetyltransferase [Microbacterium deminutum]|uniref:GNAT family N-acetyltransferase n=1 Tax=Microbacterium deminutum TaxID=344164 RepID=A0ABN2QAP1_9MICO